MMNQSKIIKNRRLVGNEKGSGTILVSALLLLTIFAVAANDIAVNDVSAATSPSLGTASSFAVLAATAITDVPTSAIKGNVGLSPASGSSYAGLTCGEVTGTIYSVDPAGPLPCRATNPGLLTTAKADLVTAYGALGSQGCDFTYAGAKDLVGSVLVQGVYCADAFTLSGTLTLSGSGVWVFKSATTLITSGTANVVGGDGCDVWWQVGSSATLGTNTQLIGNILALTSITLNTGATLNGRALAQTGAVTLAKNAMSLICAVVTTVITTPITTVITTPITTVITTPITTVISSSITVITTAVTTAITTAVTTAITTAVTTAITTAVTTAITTAITILTTVLTIIPEYPWGVFLLLILMLPVYMLLKRRNRSH